MHPAEISEGSVSKVKRAKNVAAVKYTLVHRVTSLTGNQSGSVKKANPNEMKTRRATIPIKPTTARVNVAQFASGRIDGVGFVLLDEFAIRISRAGKDCQRGSPPRVIAGKAFAEVN